MKCFLATSALGTKFRRLGAEEACWGTLICEKYPKIVPTVMRALHQPAGAENCFEHTLQAVLLPRLSVGELLTEVGYKEKLESAELQ